MAYTVPQAQRLGRDHGRLCAARTYTFNFSYVTVSLLARAEARRALLWMAAHHPFPSYMHKDIYAREFFEEFHRYWWSRHTHESRHLRRRAAASALC